MSDLIKRLKKAEQYFLGIADGDITALEALHAECCYKAAKRITELETALLKIRKDSMYLINGLHGGRVSKYFPYMVDNIIDKVLFEKSK